MTQIKYQAYTLFSKQVRFNHAINYIQAFLNQYEGNYKFKLVDKTTNNFNTFKNETLKNGYMLVSNQGNDKTIYDHAKYNVIARVWHDNIHLKHNLDFSVHDEKIVGFLQMEEIETFLDKRGVCTCDILDVKEILYHDVIGQVSYYETKKQFVNNQRKFVFARFLNNGGV